MPKKLKSGPEPVPELFESQGRSRYRNFLKVRAGAEANSFGSATLENILKNWKAPRHASLYEKSIDIFCRKNPKTFVVNKRQDAIYKIIILIKRKIPNSSRPTRVRYWIFVRELKFSTVIYKYGIWECTDNLNYSLIFRLGH